MTLQQNWDGHEFDPCRVVRTAPEREEVKA